MKTTTTSLKKRNVYSLLAIGIAFLGLQCAVHGAAFLRLGNIEGESTDNGHKDWINLLSVNQTAYKPGGGATGQSRRRGGAVVEDMRLTMEYDKASPKLQEKCLQGEIIPKLEIELYRADASGRAPEPYLKIVMTDIIITSYSATSTADGPDTPSAISISVSFSTMTQTHVSADGEETTLTVRSRKGGAVEVVEEGPRGARP